MLIPLLCIPKSCVPLGLLIPKVMGTATFRTQGYVEGVKISRFFLSWINSHRYCYFLNITLTCQTNFTLCLAMMSKHKDDLAFIFESKNIYSQTSHKLSPKIES